NSWMQTPTGFLFNEAGQFVPGESWWAIVFNPSFPYRLVHTVLAAYLTTAFVVGGVGGWQLLRHRRDRMRAPDPQGAAGRLSHSEAAARTMLSMALWMAALVTPRQIFAGHMHGLNPVE